MKHCQIFGKELKWENGQIIEQNQSYMMPGTETRAPAQRAHVFIRFTLASYLFSTNMK